MTTADSSGLLWPTYEKPADLPLIEAVPLEERGVPSTTYDLLERAAQTWPDRPAITSIPDAARWRDGVTRTFAEVHADVVAAANLLHHLGIRRGDPVTILAPNCDELITSILAAQLAGIAAPVNPSLAADHVIDLMARSGSRTVIAASADLSPDTYGLVESLARAGVLDNVLLLMPTGEQPGLDVPEMAGVNVDFLASASVAHRAPAFVGAVPSAGDLAALFHTGGTTGLPKLAAHTHRNEVADAWSLAANSVLDEDSVLFAALPLFHVNALIVTLLTPLFRGQSAIWAGPAGYRDFTLYAEIWNIVEHYRISTMSAVPTVYAVLANCPVNADISSMKFAMVGASALPSGVRTAFEGATGIRLIEGYGLTEAACATARGFLKDHQDDALGQRMPYQGVKAVRVNADGSWDDLPSGDVGVLAIGGPTVFPGYVMGRDSSGVLQLDGLGKLHQGWLDTGDLGSVDENGWIRLVGRVKDLIIRGGHNIDPAVIEDVLTSHPSVTGASAVGRPDRHAGEVPVAYVTLSADTDPSISTDDLIDFARSQLAESAAVPKDVLVIDALPVTDVGKPNKLPLRADAARREATSALAGIVGVEDISASTVDGAVRVTVHLAQNAPSTVTEDLDSILNRYALDWELDEPNGNVSGNPS